MGVRCSLLVVGWLVVGSWFAVRGSRFVVLDSWSVVRCSWFVVCVGGCLLWLRVQWSVASG